MDLSAESSLDGLGFLSLWGDTWGEVEGDYPSCFCLAGKVGILGSLLKNVFERGSARMTVFLVAGRPSGLAPRSRFFQREARSLKEVLGESAGADLDLVGQR